MSEKPHIDLLKEGPARGMWRCQSANAQTLHRGACFGDTPAAAYTAWAHWQEHVKTRPFAALGVGA